MKMRKMESEGRKPDKIWGLLRLEILSGFLYAQKPRLKMLFKNSNLWIANNTMPIRITMALSF
jgi:hypothetical protein